MTLRNTSNPKDSVEIPEDTREVLEYISDITEYAFCNQVSLEAAKRRIDRRHTDANNRQGKIRNASA